MADKHVLSDETKVGKYFKNSNLDLGYFFIFERELTPVLLTENTFNIICSLVKSACHAHGKIKSIDKLYLTNLLILASQAL